MLTIVALLLTFYFSAKTLLLCDSAVSVKLISPQIRREQGVHAEALFFLGFLVGKMISRKVVSFVK